VVLHAMSDLHIPNRLRVPTGHVLLLQAYGRGAQIYTCPDTRNPAPFAVLRTRAGDDGELIAIHYGGPLWEATDGSLFVGDVTRQRLVFAPDAGSIPWLLIPAKSTKGHGLLSSVTYIQRVQTQGGQVPSECCREQPHGAQCLVAYSAQYLFYVASTLLE
jgi:hypothetical protein